MVENLASVIFRLQIHEAAVDLGKGDTEASKQSGNSGARIACCAVVASDPHDDWTK